MIHEAIKPMKVESTDFKALNKDDVKKAVVEELGFDIANNIVSDSDKEWFEEQMSEINKDKDSEKFDLDEALKTYDPDFPRYKITAQAIEFFNLMRMVMGEDFEFSTPKAHYFMVDMLLGNITDPLMFPYSEEICNTIEIDVLRLSYMASRGIAKSTIVITFFGVYSAIKGILPNDLGRVYFYLIVTASSKGGARVNAKAVQSMCIESKFLEDIFESMRFTETESEFVRRGSGSTKSRTFLMRYQGINTAIRGIRDNHGRRPDCILADDSILNTAAAYSKTQQETLNEAIHSDSINALKGGGRARIIMTFTPFSYGDVNTRTVIEKSFTPIVIPIAAFFEVGAKTNDIRSTWIAMHPRQSIKAQQTQAIRSKTLNLFLQERMLQLTSSSDRLIPDECFQYCDMKPIRDNMQNYTMLITTDYTTTSGEKSDFSGRATFAISSDDDWFLLDISLRKMAMRAQYTDTLDQADEIKRRGSYVQIGVEIDGNQQAHVYSLEELMRKRGSYHAFARQKGAPDTRKGILSRASGSAKHERFRIISTHFLQKKVWLPEHLKDTPDMVELVNQIKGATHKEFTKSDDGPDLFSMLGQIQYSKPTQSSKIKISGSKANNSFWEEETDSVVDAGAGYS